MSTFDAIVVGGGPAGSSCAREMAAGGLDVLVVDRARFPRDKICAGWITPQVVETLGIDLADYRATRTCQPISSFSTGVIGGRQVITRYDRPISYGILRREFDWYLLERCGARLELGSPIASLRRERGTWVVNEQHRTPLLIGAGGHFCPVAKHLSTRRGPESPVVGAQEIEFPVEPPDDRDYPVLPETPELYFWPDLQGYGWCFRKGAHLNVGMGRIGGGRFAEHVRRFVQFLRDSGRAPANLPTRWPGHAYLLHGGARRLIADGAMLVGDAAGLAYPQSGEGIRTAVESGVLAAHAAIAASGRTAATDLEPYREMIHARLGEPARPAAMAWLPTTMVGAIGARLLATHWFNHHIVLDRWFLHASQPALASTASRR